MVGGRRLIVIVAAAFSFGVLVAMIKGQGAGARDALGNVSAPWLLVSFVAGTCSSRLRAAALLGSAAALVALAGFYAAEGVILDLGPHSWVTDLQLTFSAGRTYFAHAVLSGPIFGVLGGVWERRRSALAAGVVAFAFVCEPLAVWLYQGRMRVSGGTGLLTDYPWLWMSEVLLGVGGFAWIAVRGFDRSRLSSR